MNVLSCVASLEPWTDTPVVPVQLPADHDYGNPGQVTHEHRPGEQIGDEPQSRQPGDEADQADENGQAGGQHGISHGVTRHERPDRGSCQQRGR